MSGADGWDFDAQRADTVASVMQIAAEAGIAPGTPVRLDLAFEPGEGADRAAFLAAMKAEGYSGSAYTHDDGEAVIEAHVPDVPFGAEAIWSEEERAGRIALAHGWLPAGWGFEAPDEG